jgi:hypothetical protein
MPSQRMKEEGTTVPAIARRVRRLILLYRLHRACGAQRIGAALPAAPGAPHASIDDAAQRGLAPAPIAHAAVAAADGPPAVHAGSLFLLAVFFFFLRLGSHRRRSTVHTLSIATTTDAPGGCRGQQEFGHVRQLDPHQLGLPRRPLGRQRIPGDGRRSRRSYVVPTTASA